MVVGIMKSFSFGSLWNEYISSGKVGLVEYNTLRQGFVMLENRRVDALVAYELSFQYFLKENGWSEKFRSLPPFDTSRSFLMGRQLPATQLLLDQFDRGMDIIRKNGTLQEILRKWGFDG